MSLLSRELPDNLTAPEYYELGLQYRLAGWVGLAREALFRAVKLQSKGPIATKAEKVLRTQLPRLAVPEAAEQRNIEAYNLMDKDPQQAKAIFQELMSHYPDFEWPFSNLAWIKLKEGDIAGAKGLAKYLLSMNPDHLRSIHLMINVSLAEKNFEEALNYINRALELYPHDEEFTQLKLIVKIVTSGMPPDTLPEGLSAEEYQNLGIEYQMVGRFENAREALKRVIELEPGSAVAEDAGRILKTQLPKNPVPVEAEARCSEIVKIMSSEQGRAKEMFLALMSDYPDFEWPYLMMASILLLEGDHYEAERLIKEVLRNNSDFIRAKFLLVNLYMSQQRLAEALEFINQNLNDVQSDDDGLALDLLKAQCQR